MPDPDPESASRVKAYLASLGKDQSAAKRLQDFGERVAANRLRTCGAAGLAEPCDMFNEAIGKSLAGYYPWDPTVDFERYIVFVIWGVVGNLRNADARYTDRTTEIVEDRYDTDEVVNRKVVVPVASESSDPAFIVEIENDLKNFFGKLRQIDQQMAEAFKQKLAGHSWAEVAKSLGISRSAVLNLRKRLLRAIARLDLARL